MKSILTIALLVTVAVAAASDNLHVHLHMDKPITDKRFSGFVNKFMESVIDKKNVEVHFHVPSGNDEIEFGFFDDIGGAFKDLGNKIGDGVKDVGTKIGDGVVDIGKKIGDGVVDTGKKIGDGVVDAGKEIEHTAEKGFDATKHGIEVAIHKTEDAFNKVKHEIESIHLPHIDIGALIEPIMNIVHIIERLIPCAKSLKNAIPKFIAFAKAAAKDDAAGAVQELMGALQYMPEISSNCIGKVFTIPPNVMNKIQCAADIVGLVAPIVSFIAEPENVINDVNGVKSIIELLPQTISDCTGAFA